MLEAFVVFESARKKLGNEFEMPDRERRKPPPKYLTNEPANMLASPEGV